jgi:putative FmdB family regulatory protein
VPFYEYRCAKGHTFEVTQRMSDEPLTSCEVCGAKATRVLFAPAIHFKGTGFHNTDYGSKRRGTGGDEGGSSSSETSSSDTSSSNGSSDGGSSSKTTSSEGSGSSGGKTVGLDKV